jgi:adenylylsulfate kinase
VSSPTATPPAPAVAPATRTGGATVWLTGLPSAGKTTVARELAAQLSAAGVAVELLDGDEVRTHLSAGLGYDRAGRSANVSRIGWVAATLARHGVVVLVAAVSPYAEDRDAVRALHDAAALPFLEIHVAAPIEVTSVRDVKGLYAKQAGGGMTGMTGVDDPYEPPVRPELVLATHAEPLEQSVAALLALLTARGLA